MKKYLLLVPLMASSALAFADGSVTLYGQIDNGLQFESGLAKGSLFGAATGNWAPSRFGIKGTEDLGGGTQAIFTLESGFSTLSGALSGNLFDRQATVGLTNPVWGTFKVGRMGEYEIQQDSFDLDPQLMQEYSIVTLVRGRNWSLASNGFEYTSPKWGGLTLKGQYDLTNSTTWNSGNPGSGPGQLGGAQGRSDGIEITYETGPMELMAIYDEIRDSNGEFDNVYVNSRSLMAGMNYSVGPVKVYVGYQHLAAPQASNQGYFGSDTPTALPGGVTLPTALDHEWLGALWQATTAASFTAAVYHANANNGNGNATLFTLGGTYALSKRTFLYSEVGAVRNSSTSNVGLGDGYTDPYGANVNDDPASGASNFRTNPNYGGTQTGVFAGIVTQF
ncbi:porin [Pararobbsia alpina]|uniref:Outer membrane porin protein n=1 Tax=Pararobbsia alpina TaxID=621374 RepID=A0A6S7BH07_9BURK|nr:porin [Pararobbsia alpina]CAB3798445.1 Outer membrane porin protein [Pararobbsia alpina]